VANGDPICRLQNVSTSYSVRRPRSRCLPTPRIASPPSSAPPPHQGQVPGLGFDSKAATSIANRVALRPFLTPVLWTLRRWNAFA